MEDGADFQRRALREAFGDSSDSDADSPSAADSAMRFGDFPEWATELTSLVREAVCVSEISSRADQEACPLPLDLLWREPLFDQLIANVYKPGEGICAHVDLMRFEDGIAIVSLESPCIMHFTRPTTDMEVGTTATLEEDRELTKRVPVLLTPGSLVLMSGEVRYLWKHEINRKPGNQVWEGKEIQQGRRTSVTLRKLCPSPPS
ncbi:Uncharacterized protein P8A3.02c [Ananas comosus]|uniref:Uncharacterized protein P8A3.02c n=1 Tax=Ananas comosus TaxID=4615 RepID=A0A199VZM3_ANACO|nr:Uncharacterized protein P8A3.02c [Ananas comosus]